MLLFASCEEIGTAKFGDAPEAKSGAAPTSSSLSFLGVDSIDEVTNSTARLNWSSDPEAVAYDIYNVTSGTSYITTVFTGTTSYTVTGLSSSTTYSFRVQAKDSEGSNDGNTKNLSVTTLLCPDGYISVPANSNVGTNENFCVMKYEAKAWDDANSNGVIDASEVDADGCGEGACTTANWGIATHSPVSVEEGHPWREIDQVKAWEECDSLNSEGNRADIDNDDNADGTYALISNPEWMTIARNVENVAANWTDGAVGDGCLLRGNVGGPHSCAGTDGTFDSGYNGPGPDSGSVRNDNGTAQLALSNGQIVWDLSGNVAEWVDWDMTSTLSTNMPQSGMASDLSDQNSGWKEYTDLDTFTAHSPATSLLPSDPLFNANQGTGRYYYITSDSRGAALRGGTWDYSNDAGAFALSLNCDSGCTYTHFGFRCVFRP